MLKNCYITSYETELSFIEKSNSESIFSLDWILILYSDATRGRVYSQLPPASDEERQCCFQRLWKYQRDKHGASLRYLGKTIQTTLADDSSFIHQWLSNILSSRHTNLEKKLAANLDVGKDQNSTLLY